MIMRIVARLTAGIGVFIFLSSGILLDQNSAEAHSVWRPEPATYGYAIKHDVPVRMDDGVVLKVDVYYPTDPKAGVRARGVFPVLLEQTPYGKSGSVVKFDKTAQYFVRRGYILAVADLRGFGKSEGQAAWFGSRMGRDGAELSAWAGHLKGADGKVGLMGCSYLGVVQFFTAKSLPLNSPVKAMAPFCVDSNFYRDLTAFGGIPTQFVAVDRAVTAPGVDDNPATDPFMQTIISEGLGDTAYYDGYWAGLNVTTFMRQIVALGIPMLTESGWIDLFPGGNLDAYVAAQNAFNHRDVNLALPEGGAVSPKYQAIVGPWTHGEHLDDALQPILLRWFDTWLKNENTGMATTKTPLHLFVRGENRWIDSSAYPVSKESASFMLSPGKLTRKGYAWPCGKGSDASNKCSESLMWAPEGQGTILSFNSKPLTTPLDIAGPGDLTVFVKSTRPDVELAATLFDVSPSGVITKVTNGVQLGSQRALDKKSSWYSSSGTLIRPSHYFTRASSRPVKIDQRTQLDIELLPAMMRIPAGDTLRLEVVSEPAGGFHQYGPRVQMRNPMMPTPQELINLTGGIYTILFGGPKATVLNLTVAKDTDLHTSATDWGPSR